MKKQWGYPDLPEGYIKKEEINLKENKKQFWLVNIGSLLLAAPLIILLFFLEFTISFGNLEFVYTLLLVLAALILTIIIHELIHGLFFKTFYRKGKLKFKFHGFAVSCGMPDVYFKRNAYMVVGLAPFVILNVILSALSVVFYQTNYFLVFYISLVVNFSGCIGDLFVTYKLLRIPKTAIVNDYGIGMNLYDIMSNKEHGQI